MHNRLIYDVGMHNGDDTAYYLHRGYEVLAVEADPTLCAEASLRFQDALAAGRLTILNIGVASNPGLQDFWICDGQTAWNSFDKSIASRDGLPHHRIQIACQTFDWILEKFGIPYYLKIDIEGNDHLCLEGLRDFRDLPRYISCELGDLDSISAALDQLGFSRFKLVSQFTFLPLETSPTKEQKSFSFWNQIALGQGWRAKGIRKGMRWLGQEWRIAHRRDRLRRHADWAFPWGSSGPFGEDTVGPWHGLEEVRQIFRSFRELIEKGAKSSFWTDADYSFWVDLHARRE